MTEPSDDIAIGREELVAEGIYQASTLMDSLESLIPSTGWGLYGGLAGAAVFLARVGSVTTNEPFIRVAEETLDVAWAKFAADASTSTSLSDGLAGLAYASYVVAGVSGSTKPLLRSVDALLSARVTYRREETIDLLSGLPGLLLAMIRLHQAGCQATGWLSRIDSLAQRVLRAAHNVTQRRPRARLLCGLSHGLSGASFVLCEAYEVTRRTEYRDAAIDLAKLETAIGYEDGLGWQDFRYQGRVFTNAWCHGAAGIGLARMKLLSIAPDDAHLRADLLASAALCTVPCQWNDQPCCGELGRAAFLSSVGMVLGSGEVRRSAQARAEQVVMRKRGRSHFVNGSSGPVDDWGLFQGRSGIGYSLLIVGSEQHLDSFLEFA